ncbi:hypothetical protein EW146_g2429 [Bondarzewia mesenterica]|uniref:intramembrane prenyl-peptidase Rce1 n=1 Tax=Bondarzewia mesenterica TaxID=1095465 RepID=A0A4S4M276_9AGAM|nr:hypothetical protein EW146_g2429 [Bondarzewia mesenterica]
MSTTGPKSLRSRMGTMMRRTSSGFSFNRPPTPGSRASSESLRLDASSLAPPSVADAHKLPSPVPESPAREGAAEAAEAAEQNTTGPSPLAAAPLTAPSEPIDISAPKPVEPGPATWGSGNVVSTPEQMSAVGSVRATHSNEDAGVRDSSRATSSLGAEESVLSSDSHSHNKPHESDAPHRTEMIAAPWGRSMESLGHASDAQHNAAPEPQREMSVTRSPWTYPESTTSTDEASQKHSKAASQVDLIPTANAVKLDALVHPAVNTDDNSSTVTTPRPIENPAFEQTLAKKKSAASIGTKSRTRASTVSSQARPVTPAPANGTISAKPSKSSLAPSVAHKAEDVKHVLIIEPVSGDGQSSQDVEVVAGNPFADPEQTSPSFIEVHSPAHDRLAATGTRQEPPKEAMPESIVMPLPAAQDVNYSRPVRNVPSNYSLAGRSSINSPMDHLEFETDETRPLLRRPSTPSLPALVKERQFASQPVAVYFRPSDSSIWPMPSHNFESTGWREHILPDSSVYFSHASLSVTADVDLRNPGKLEAVSAYLGGGGVGSDMVLPPEGWELWLRDAGMTKNDFVPARAWVHHAMRAVSLEQPPMRSDEIHIPEEDRLGMEHRYWSFIESHPAHAPLPPSSLSEAMDILTWSYTDRLLPSSHPLPPPFTQDECQELMGLLRSLDSSINSPTQSMVRTRIIAKILLRITAWRQGHPPPARAKDGSKGSGSAERHVPFRRTLFDFLISILCLGLPYLFLDRSHHQRMDTESGMHDSAGPMLIIGACACLIAAVILSASVTFISLPGLDDVARVAGFIAIILSASSMISAVIALFRFKSDIERSSAYYSHEGVVMLSRRSVLLSLPLVFLIWSITAFITGVALYAFRGTSIGNVGQVIRHFEEYTRWAVVGTIGGLAGMLIMSALLGIGHITPRLGRKLYTRFNSHPLSLSDAHLWNVAFTLGYVVPLYLTRHTRLSFSTSASAGTGRDRVKQPDERWRDDPAVIRARLLSASISTIVACYCFYLIIVSTWGDPHVDRETLWDLISHRLGFIFWEEDYLAYLVTPALYLGPLYVRYLGKELPFMKRWTFKEHILDTFFTWKGFRNFIVGPITEELVWRSCIIAVYNLAGVSTNFLVFFTPISFGAAHLHHSWEVFNRYGRTFQAFKRAFITTIFQFTYTTLFGFHCAFLFLRTNSVLHPLSAHIFCNLMGVPQYSAEVRFYHGHKKQIRIMYVAGIVAYIYTMRYWTLSESTMYWSPWVSHLW